MCDKLLSATIYVMLLPVVAPFYVYAGVQKLRGKW